MARVSCTPRSYDVPCARTLLVVKCVFFSARPAPVNMPSLIAVGTCYREDFSKQARLFSSTFPTALRLAYTGGLRHRYPWNVVTNPVHTRAEITPTNAVSNRQRKVQRKDDAGWIDRGEWYVTVRIIRLKKIIKRRF